MKYVITYDLNGKNKDYEKLFHAIADISTDWSRPCESTWVIETHLTIEEVGSAISLNVDSNDSYFVAEMGSIAIAQTSKAASKALRRIIEV